MGESEPDWYAVLGAGPSSSQVEIRRLHRQAVKEQHPDRTQHLRPARRAALEAAFIQVTAAWAVLGDPGARAAYDRRASRREAQRAAARQAGERRREDVRASRPGSSADRGATAPRVPTPRAPLATAPGADHHEFFAVPEDQLRGGVTVTDPRTGATYGPFHQAGVFCIRAHGGASTAGGPRGHLVLHVTVQDPGVAAAIPEQPVATPWRRWRALAGWRALAAAGGVVLIGQELLPRR